MEKKSSTTIKVASYVLFRELTEDYSPEDSTEDLFQTEKGGVFAEQNQTNKKHKKPKKTL